MILDTPPVSVLLACYNGERWLAEAIESILGQTFENFEFLIVDDGSSDNSPELIRQFAERDSRVVVITKRNTGLADSLNVGIGRARGEWIARIDADDICEPLRLERQLEAARESPDLVFIGTGLTTIDENGRTIKSYSYPKRHAELVRNLRTARKFPPHSSAFYRTGAVRAVGGYRVRIKRSEDRDLWLRLSEVGLLAALTEPLVRIRKHPDQISHDNGGRTQQVDSRVAMVSYWLRRHGSADPVSAESAVFDEFRAWVAERSEQERFPDLSSYIALAKARIETLRSSPLGIVALMQHLVGRPELLIRWLRGHLMGDAFSCRLANEWAHERTRRMRRFSV